jgi:hypothetical protein
MRSLLSGLVAASLLIATAQLGFARCGDEPDDAQQVADARQQVADDCECATAETHGAYVSCAAGVVNARVLAGSLRPQCKGSVRRCAARSTCGKPGFVACCRTRADGVTKCSTKRDGLHCVPPEGGSACVGTQSSCCDACTTSGCAP